MLDTYPVGERPVGLAAATEAIWVVNERSGTLSRVVTGDGETQSIPVGRGPTAVAFGAEALWVTNAGDGTVTRIDPSTGIGDDDGAGRRNTRRRDDRP